MSDKPVRVRIAPSPTGEPHVGTAYIALMNLCYAKKHGGKFILRIEDTDQARSTPESEQQILSTLDWLGLRWDEGPDVGGPFGPYRQSERKDIYLKHVEELLQKKRAYRCFCTVEDLDGMRKKQMARKEPPGYFGRHSPCRNLAEAEVRKKIEAGDPCVVRMAVTDGDGEIGFVDHVRKQEIKRKLSEIDDQIILKSDGMPTYHLASVVDDHLMEISHVFRGEEWINSTYKHVLLYEAFGWEAPLYFHLGLLRNMDKNKSKISKRKNPVSLRWFRAAGYLSEALVNFLGLMGYSRVSENLSEEDRKNCEKFSLDTMVSDFDETRLSPTGAAFDFVKLDDLNFHYISRLSFDDFYKQLNERQTFLKDYFGPYNALFLERYTRAEREVTFWTAFLFKSTLDYKKEDFLKSGLKSFADGVKYLKALKKSLSTQTEIIQTPEQMKDFIYKSAEELGIDSSSIHMLLRVAVTGSTESLPLYESMILLGLYRCLVRFDEAGAFLASIRS